MTGGDQFNMSGDFRGAVINIKSKLMNVAQTVESLPNDDASKEQLTDLIHQLVDALEKLPPDHIEEAEAVAESAKVLVDAATKANPNRPLIQITGEGLKKAAENLGNVTPNIIMIAAQIVSTVFKIVG